MGKAARVSPDNGQDLPPETSRLQDFPHPRETPVLFGHEQASATLEEAWAAGKMHHAWLLSGPLGIGKASLAYGFARQMMGAEKSKPDDPVFRQIAQLAHPNVLSLNRPYNEKTKKPMQFIPVEQVRRLKGFLGRTRGADGYRVVIVDSADDFNSAAANALLKMLEEPPHSTVFFLISHAPGRLLPTIRSRCRKLSCHALEDTDLQKAVMQALNGAGLPPLPASDFDALGWLANGQPRRMLEIAQGDASAVAKGLLDIFGALPRLEYAKVHLLADKVCGAGADAEFALFCALMLDLVRHVVRGAAQTGAAPKINALTFVTQAKLSPGALAQWAELWDTLVAEMRETRALNLDRRSFLLVSFARLEATARRTITG